MAMINQALLTAMSKGFNNIFAKAFKETKTNYDKVATVIKVNTMSVDYGFLGGFSNMREWIGDRTLRDLVAHKYTITKKDWENTIEVSRDVIEFDQLGIVKPQIQQMAHDGQSHYDDILFSLLEKNDKCYDGKPFFSNAHEVGKTKMSNLGNAKLNQQSFMDARAEMRGITSDGGKSLKIKPTLLLVPPELEQQAIELLNKDFLANGESNITKGLSDYLVIDELSDDKAWYLLDTSRPLKPLILQKTKEIKFTAMDKVDDESVFMRKAFRYGIDSQDNAGYGLWQLAYKSTGEK